MENARVLLIALFVSAFVFDRCLVQANMADSCAFTWGEKRGKWTGPDSLDLVLEKYGGSGIKSKADFLYGIISVKIKLVPGNSAGTVTTFYISSTGDKHDEIDFEFLGNATGQPYTIHTNIFTQGFGQREQQFKVWFDPSSDYHTYTIFWNPYAVVWLVDGTPIRVFRNYHDSEINFPDSQAMKTFASLWNADDWATQGGRVKTDWSHAPFKAHFKNYNENVCHSNDDVGNGKSWVQLQGMGRNSLSLSLSIYIYPPMSILHSISNKPQKKGGLILNGKPSAPKGRGERRANHQPFLGASFSHIPPQFRKKYRDAELENGLHLHVGVHSTTWGSG